MRSGRECVARSGHLDRLIRSAIFQTGAVTRLVTDDRGYTAVGLRISDFLRRRAVSVTDYG